MSRLLPAADQETYDRAIQAVRRRAHGMRLATSEYACAWDLARALQEGDTAKAENLARRLGIPLEEVER